MTQIIGLLGPAGAGKSSVAGYLVEKYGATRFSFAAPLKEISMRVMGFTHEQCWGTQEQKEAIDSRYGFSARTFMQRLGTEGCRAVMGADIWTKTCLSQIYRASPRLAVIEDVRFINEAEAIMRCGSVWRLEPPADEPPTASIHASEVEWLTAPYTTKIAPAKRGLPELFIMVDWVCGHEGIFSGEGSKCAY